MAVGPDLVVILDYISAIRSREENETQQMVVMPDLVVVSVVRSREDNETRQMAVSPALVVVLDVSFDVSIKDHEESETKQMAAMPDLIVISMAEINPTVAPCPGGEDGPFNRRD